MYVGKGKTVGLITQLSRLTKKVLLRNTTLISLILYIGFNSETPLISLNDSLYIQEQRNSDNSKSKVVCCRGSRIYERARLYQRDHEFES